MNWLKVLVGIAAVMIAGCAAYFSITGLGILFSGASISVMIMAGSLEGAKLVTATYLKQKWNEIKGFNKWYLTIAVAILMAITSAGIFGYLSNAFQQQNIKIEQVQREVDVYNNRITVNNQQISNLTAQISNLQSNQGKIIDNGKVNNRLLRSLDDRDKQVNTISSKISLLQQDNVNSNDSINKIKNQNINIEREVGGFRFVAEAFGVELKKVVKFFIILIVFVFDPLAIALVIAFNQLIMDKKKLEEDISFEDEIIKEEVERFENDGFTESEIEPIISQIVKQHEDEKKVVPNISYVSPIEEEFSLIEPTKEEEDENFHNLNPNVEYNGQIDDWWNETVPEPFATPEEVEKYHIDEPNPNTWTPQLEEQYWKEEGKQHVQEDFPTSENSSKFETTVPNIEEEKKN